MNPRRSVALRENNPMPAVLEIIKKTTDFFAS